MTDSNPTVTPCLTFCSPELSSSYSIIPLLFSGLLSQLFSLRCGYFLHVALRVVGHSLTPDSSVQLFIVCKSFYHFVPRLDYQIYCSLFYYNEPAFIVLLIIYFMFFSNIFTDLFPHSRNILLPGSFLSVKIIVSSLFALRFIGT